MAASSQSTGCNVTLPLDMTEIQRRWYFNSGVWFWTAIALGTALRFYLVVFTEGTQDVAIWERHARDVRDRGLIGYYHGDPSANHPPFISEAEALLVRASEGTGIPFRILLRAPFALVDAGTAFLLLLLLGDCRWRFVAAARNQFVDQTSNRARDSRVCVFHSGLAQTLSVLADRRSRRACDLRSSADSRSGDHLEKCLWLSRPNFAHDRRRPGLGTASAFIFNHRCTTKLAGRFSCSDFVFSRE